MKIKTIKDIVEASNQIIGNIVGQNKVTGFCLTVDHGDGTLSFCAWTPTSATYRFREGDQFCAVEDYAKIMVLLLTHPKISNMEYNEKDHTVYAVLAAPEMQEVQRLENPFNGEDCL